MTNLFKQWEKGKEWIRSSKAQSLPGKRKGFCLLWDGETLCPSRTPCRRQDGKRKLLFLKKGDKRKWESWLGYWGPTEGLTLDLRKARPNPFWDRKMGLQLQNYKIYKYKIMKLVKILWNYENKNYQIVNLLFYNFFILQFYNFKMIKL